MSDLATGVTAEQLADLLVAEGGAVTISNVRYSGASAAAGTFSGGSSILGFERGIVLSSGAIGNVVGPNVGDSITANNGQPGDSDLDGLIPGASTRDATVLEFDFVPQFSQVAFQYVFSSEEYNEYVNSVFNDVFGFFLNGQNVALLPGTSTPVAINNVNGGNPLGVDASNSQFYQSNDLSDGGGSINTEMDGLTVVLSVQLTVQAGAVNHLKLAIADAGDESYDSNVFIKTGSLVSTSLSISHIEVTQAIQTPEDDIPLIVGKPTFARVYVDCGTGCSELPNVSGELRAFGSGGQLPGSPLRLSGKQSITAKRADWQTQRGDLGATLNFTLPPDWADGTVTLRAIVVGDFKSVSLDRQKTFNPAKTLKIVYVPIEHQGNKPDPNRIPQGADWTRRIYPTADISYEAGDGLTWPIPLSGLAADGGQELLLNALALKRVLSGIDAFLVGWLPAGTLNYGVASGIFPVALADDHPVIGQRIFAHEVAHLLGRDHTKPNLPKNCENPTPTQDSDWPDPATARIGKSHEYGLDGYGFAWLNSSSSAVHRESGPYDYMSYCADTSMDNAWTSAWTYRQLYAERFSVAAPTAAAKPLGAPQPSFFVSGLAYTDDTATLDPIWVTSSSAVLSSPPAGSAYCVEAENSAGAVLAGQCFDLKFVNQVTDQATAVAGFSLQLPYASNAARIVLRKGTQRLLTKSVTANAPVVRVLSPNGGESWPASGSRTVTWTGSDADGDALTYSVLYSPDGTTWRPLGTATTQTQLTLDTAELPGGTNARIRVLATDGVNTSSDDSDAAFSVGRKGPRAFIQSPDGDVSLTASTPLLLKGSGHDAEDGTLGDSALRWTSNRDGALGTGSRVLANLSPGQHTVTLTATDSSGNPATATRTITLAPTADLAVTNDDGLSTVVPGGAVTYTITVTNNGPSWVAGVGVVDNFPAAISGLAWTCDATDASSCGAASGNGDIDTTVDLAVGGRATFSATGIVSGTASGTLSNTASAAAPSGVTDATSGNNSVTDSDAVSPAANLAVTKTRQAGAVAADQNITYTLMVTNSGPVAATDVELSDEVPFETTFQSITKPPSWNCTAPPIGGTGTVSCTIPSLAPGGGASTFSLVVKVDTGTPVGTTISNEAFIASSTVDPSSDDNSASVSVVTTAIAPDLLSISKIGPASSVGVGDNLTYTLTVANNGSTTATGVKVTDKLPRGLSFVSATADQGTCSKRFRTVTCNLGTLAAGADATITLVVRPGRAGTITNTARVTATQSDPNPSNNSDSAQTTVTP